MRRGKQIFHKKFTLMLLHPLPHQHREPAVQTHASNLSYTHTHTSLQLHQHQRTRKILPRDNHAWWGNQRKLDNYNNDKTHPPKTFLLGWSLLVQRPASSHRHEKWNLFSQRRLTSGDVFQAASEQTSPASLICKRPPSPAAAAGVKHASVAAFIEIESSFPLTGGNVNVSFTPVLSFIMIKQFIPRERGKRETGAAASFIACPVSFTRLWFSIMLLSAAVKRPAGIETNLSYSTFWFRSFSLSSLLLAYSFFTCDCQPVKVILNQSNPL